MHHSMKFIESSLSRTLSLDFRTLNANAACSRVVAVAAPPILIPGRKEMSISTQGLLPDSENPGDAVICFPRLISPAIS